MAMTATAYRIDDEPRPGTLAHLAVRPLWPLFAFMFAGVWLSWPWFAWNAWVVGSPTRRKEILWSVGGALGLFGLARLFVFLGDAGILPPATWPYMRIVLTLWKLAVSYALFFLQARTFQIYEHYGGPVRNGILLVVVGFYLRPWLVEHGMPGFF